MTVFRMSVPLNSTIIKTLHKIKVIKKLMYVGNIANERNTCIVVIAEIVMYLTNFVCSFVGKVCLKKNKTIKTSNNAFIISIIIPILYSYPNIIQKIVFCLFSIPNSYRYIRMITIIQNKYKVTTHNMYVLYINHITTVTAEKTEFT